MEYNNPSELIKSLSFGQEAKDKIIAGVDKLTKAVKSTLGASGKCVIYEDMRGKPVITKDGVTVAESVVLLDPVENIGATLIKEAAKNTVKEAGDGTTTATVLAESLLKNALKANEQPRKIKDGIRTYAEKVYKYLEGQAIPVEGKMLHNVATISCNNDKELGDIISDAYTKVGKDGVVLMEEAESDITHVEIVDGVQLESGLKSGHLITDKDKQRCVLDNPAVLIVSSPIPNIRKIQPILEHVIKNKVPLLIVAEVDQQVSATLLMNKVKGNIKVNFIDPPGFGPTKQDTIEDLALLTGAKVINEELGDDLDLIDPSVLGEAFKAVTEEKSTVLTTSKTGVELKERIADVEKKIKKEKNPYLKRRLDQRLAMLNGSVGLVKVGADSKIELKEKKDRVEDAIYAVKAALKDGIVLGGGRALAEAAINCKVDNEFEEILQKTLLSPYQTILENADLDSLLGVNLKKGEGIDVTTGKIVNMVKTGIIDPFLVTKTALKHAISVVSTIISADCVISNVRIEK
jgi:chaperonin GroEL